MTRGDCAYLDYNATTPVRPEVLEEMLPYFREHYGNPGSPYFLGQKARKTVERARERVASFLNAKDPQEIVFTSCGSESDALAVSGAAWSAWEESFGRAKPKIVSTAVEHDAVRTLLDQLQLRGFKRALARVDEHGLVAADEFERLITPETAVVSVMHANNEVGTVEPIEKIAGLCRTKGVLFHTDAVQSAGKVPLDVQKMNVDMLSISGHKIGAPKGVGALYVRGGVRLSPVITGHQEKNRRGGTENVALITGLGAACELARKDLADAKKQERYEFLRRQIADATLKIPGSAINGHPSRRLSTCIHMSFSGVDGHALVIALDLAGVCVSSGPACSTGSPQPSHVLTAMGVPPELAQGSLRVSFGHATSEEDIRRLAAALPDAVEKLRGVPAAR
ncbi:MAG TPA: aminotransferase class V-fold PLP-dependent enzyme [Elusimicrobiota bacterium]|nr:aminotransferase class V-fold PLP-dependent enzyme [Elusimicrobiota bacterium]